MKGESRRNGRATAGSRGAAIVALRARPKPIARTLGTLSPALGLLTAPPALAAAAEGVWPLAAALAAPAVVSAAIWLVARRTPPPADIRSVEALVSVALAFLIGGFTCVPAFVVLGLTSADAVFESFSGLTATGLSVARDAQSWPVSAHFLRAWMQWVGALAFLAGALALVVGPGAVARRLGEAGMSGAGENLLASTTTRARSILELYLALTLAAMLAGAALATGPVEGVLLALTAIATGGFSPDAGSLDGESLWLQAAIMGFCVIGAVSFPLLIRARRGGFRMLVRDPSLRVMVYLLVGGAAITLAILWGNGASREALVDGAVAVVSAQTTAGFSAGPTAALPSTVLIVLIALMAIGGDVGSTAGGIKLSRIVVALSAVRLTLWRAQEPPGAVSQLRALDHHFEAPELASLAAMATVYAMVTGALWMGLLMVKADPLPALFDAVSTISNVGLSAGVIGPDLHPALKLAAAAAMLLGRLEFFAVVVLLRPATWVPRGV